MGEFRAGRDESHLSDAQKVAWEYILPYKYLPLLDSDYARVRELSKYLEKAFSKQALKAAVKRMDL